MCCAQRNDLYGSSPTPRDLNYLLYAGVMHVFMRLLFYLSMTMVSEQAFMRGCSV